MPLLLNKRLSCNQELFLLLPWPDGPDVGGPHRFTNTAVSRFDGTGCWQQHLLVFQAIMKSNGWSPDTAAIQLFAYLDGEALQVALLLPDRIRERWKDLVDELSAYYKTPGRLVVFRRQFENAHRRPGSDPATFATELGILALRGFSDMKEKARDLMVCNKFIASQQSCDLRWHLDSATSETSIVDIVDSCRIWESHAEPVAIGNWCQNPVYSQPKLLMPPPATGSSEFTVGSVMPQFGGQGANHTQCVRGCGSMPGGYIGTATEYRTGTVITGRNSRWVSDDTRDILSGASAGGGGGTPPHMDDLGDRDQCFSCGFFGHGVNRCLRLDISFPYKMPGWSVDVQDGQYHASRMRRDEQDLRRGKEGWFGRDPCGGTLPDSPLTDVVYPAGPDGPVGPAGQHAAVGTLSPSDCYPAGPVGPCETSSLSFEEIQEPLEHSVLI